MSQKQKITVLFLCTGNSCRSQMAEALLRQLGGDRFEALSAGSHPAGFIHDLALEAMRILEVPMVEQQSKSWELWKEKSVDAVITLCDNAAREACPVWSGEPVTTHWPLPDPVYYLGSDEDRIDFTIRVAKRLRTKIAELVALDWSLSPEQLSKRLRFLGEI